MNTQITRALIRKSTVATLLAIAAMAVSGCSTTPLSMATGEKTVSYKELHGMMVRLAQETTQVSVVGPVAVDITASTDAETSRTLAVNP